MIKDIKCNEKNFWTKYIFSQDHKVIGLQYGITALLFLLFGFILMLVMRYQMVHLGTIHLICIIHLALCMEQLWYF